MTMGQILSYAIATSLILTVLYLPYKWLLSGIKRPMWNRLTLMVIYIVALGLLPLAAIMKPADAATLQSAGIEIGLAIIEPIEGTATESSARLTDWLVAVYTAGLIIMAARWIYAAMKIRSVINDSYMAEVDGTIIYVTDRKGMAPFSVFGRIIIPKKDLDDAPLIVAHERVHVARRHSSDLLLGQLVTVMQWFNPAAWLMLSELKAVHEYEADNGVIESGVNIKEYQLLLIKKAVGERLPSPANSLNHSNLKTRITMMMKSKKTGNSRWRYLALVPAAAVALSVTNIQAVADTLRDVASSSLPQLTGSEVNDYSAAVQESVEIAIVSNADADANLTQPTVTEANATVAVAEAAPTAAVSATEEAAENEAKQNEVFSAVEQMPQYPGGDAAMLHDLAMNLTYPENAMKENRQGRVVVRFVVDTDGTIKDPSIIRGQGEDLDKAAIDAVMKLKPFTPGMNNGKPVAVYYVLPVSFKLQGDEVSTPASESADKANESEKISVIGLGSSFDSSQAAKLTVFVDGKKIAKEQLMELDPNKIESMAIEKDDPAYPDGKVLITLKKD